MLASFRFGHEVGCGCKLHQITVVQSCGWIVLCLRHLREFLAYDAISPFQSRSFMAV